MFYFKVKTSDFRRQPAWLHLIVQITALGLLMQLYTVNKVAQLCVRIGTIA